MRRLTTVTTGGTNLLSNLDWSPAGLPTGWTYGNGVTASFGWTPERLLLSEIRYDRPQPGGTMLNLTYEYGTAVGNDGRIKKINDLVVPDRTVHFEYDGLSRLKRAHTEGGATYPAWELTWGYSAAGNREAQTAVVGNPPASSLAFDPATNRVTSTGWTHDTTGNVTATPDGTFSIDAAGRTIGHTPGSGPALAFAFDATGLRTKRTEGASTTFYLREGGQVVGEWNGTSWTKEYVWLGSTLLATIEGSTIKYHHQDHLSIRATTFADGMVGEEQGHYPFGEPWYETSPETTRIFTTYEREAGGSLDYAMFRWMGPEAGRFLSADPVHGSMGDGQSWNRYAYAGNDPVNRWDPWGLFFTDAGSPEVSSLFDPITGASGAGGGGGASGGCEDGDSYVCGYTDGSPIYCWCVDGVWVAFFDTVEGTAKGPAQPRGWQGLVWYVSMPGGGSRGGGGGGAGGGGSLSRGGCTWIDGSRDPFLVEWGAYMANLAALANPSRGEFYAGFAPAPGPLSGFRMTAGPTYLPYDQTRGRAGGNVSAPIHTTIFVHTHAWAGLAPHLSSSNFSVADFSPGAILDPKNPMSSLTHYVVGFEGWSMYRGGIVYCLRNVPGAGGR